MPTEITLPSGATATFVDAGALNYHQEQALQGAASGTQRERFTRARRLGIDPATLPEAPTDEEMLDIDVAPFEWAISGALCMGWSHPYPPPSTTVGAEGERWKTEAPLADVKAVLAHGLQLLGPMLGRGGEDPGAPLDSSSTSPTISTPTATPGSTSTTSPLLPSGDSSPSPVGPLPS